MKKFVIRVYGYIMRHGPSFFKRPAKYIYRTFLVEYREKKVHLGKLNPDKTFYVIRNMTEGQGLLNNYIEVLRKIQYAHTKGYIPIVDFLNYYRPGLQDENCAHKENSWDYYFNQPQTEYSLEEIYNSRNVILSYGIDIKDNEGWPKYKSEDAIIEPYCQLYNEYASINPEIMNAVNENYSKLFEGKKNVLGIAFRRSLERGIALGIPWYTNALCHHPKMNFAQLKKKIEKYMKEDKFDAFFLTGDDRETIEYFKDKYKDKCIVFDRMLPHYFKNDIPVVMNEDVYEEHHDKDKLRVTLAKEYLIESVLLARCNSILGIETSVCVCARIFNNDSYEKRLD